MKNLLSFILIGVLAVFDFTWSSASALERTDSNYEPLFQEKSLEDELTEKGPLYCQQKADLIACHGGMDSPLSPSQEANISAVASSIGQDYMSAQLFAFSTERMLQQKMLLLHMFPDNAKLSELESDKLFKCTNPKGKDYTEEGQRILDIAASGVKYSLHEDAKKLKDHVQKYKSKDSETVKIVSFLQNDYMANLLIDATQVPQLITAFNELKTEIAALQKVYDQQKTISERLNERGGRDAETYKNSKRTSDAELERVRSNLYKKMDEANRILRPLSRIVQENPALVNLESEGANIWNIKMKPSMLASGLNRLLNKQVGSIHNDGFSSGSIPGILSGKPLSEQLGALALFSPEEFSSKREFLAAALHEELEKNEKGEHPYWGFRDQVSMSLKSIVNEQIDDLEDAMAVSCGNGGRNLHLVQPLVDEFLNRHKKKANAVDLVTSEMGAQCSLWKRFPPDEGPDLKAVFAGIGLLGAGGVTMLSTCLQTFGGGCFAGGAMMKAGGALLAGGGTYLAYHQGKASLRSYRTSRELDGLLQARLARHDQVGESMKNFRKHASWSGVDAALIGFDVAAFRHAGKGLISWYQGSKAKALQESAEAGASKVKEAKLTGGQDSASKNVSIHPFHDQISKAGHEKPEDYLAAQYRKLGSVFDTNLQADELAKFEDGSKLIIENLEASRSPQMVEGYSEIFSSLGALNKSGKADNKIVREIVEQVNGIVKDGSNVNLKAVNAVLENGTPEDIKNIRDFLVVVAKKKEDMIKASNKPTSWTQAYRSFLQEKRDAGILTSSAYDDGINCMTGIKSASLDMPGQDTGVIQFACAN